MATMVTSTKPITKKTGSGSTFPGPNGNGSKRNGHDHFQPDPRANRYEYKLDGFDTAWVRADERRAATYTNLPGGKYVFRVRASNSDGVWSTQDLALPIEVAPSPWLSPVAYVSYTLLAAFMLLTVWYAQQRRLARAAAHRMELEQQVSDRTFELAEL